MLLWELQKSKIVKNAGRAEAQGILISTGFELARQVYSDKEVDGDKLIETGLVAGADFTVKAAVAGGLKSRFNRIYSDWRLRESRAGYDFFGLRSGLCLKRRGNRG